MGIRVVCTMNEKEEENEKCGLLVYPPLLLSACLLFQKEDVSTDDR